MKIYFAGSIRGGRKDKKLYLKIIEILKNYGRVLTEHVGNKNLSSVGENLNEKEIYKRDMKWLDSSDVVIAEVTQPSLGVGYEIGRIEKIKPVLCIYRESKNKRLSAMIAGNPNLILKKYKNLKDINNIFSDFFNNLLKNNLLKK